jgi:sugar lactone lactonase YvrE
LDIAKKIPPVVLVCAAALFPAENVINYASVITVSDFLAVGDTLWAASTGGLVAHELRSGGNTLISNAKIFPDPFLTAFCRDSRGNLWIGSQHGYLYRRTPQGQFTTYSSYKVSGWEILCLFSYDDLIVVGSNKGMSLFDPEKGIAVRNATGIGTFSNPRVNAVAAFGDTLFLGCEEGVAYLDSLNIVPLGQRNFYYADIWKTRPGGSTASFSNAGNSVAPDTVPSAVFRGYKFTADSGKVVYYGRNGRKNQVLSVPSGRILKLYNEDDARLWVGTDERFYYSFDGESVAQYLINGLTLRRGTRVAVAPNSDVWVLPVASYPNSWYHGIYRYDGGSWHMYSSLLYDDRFGYSGDGGATGLAFGRGGTLWAGTWGGNIKHIDPAKNTVGQLIVGNKGFATVNYYDNVAPAWDTWGKVDALSMDSSGYLWASVYDHDSGSLVCYDPRYKPVPWETDPVKAHYRWFFSEPSLKTFNITELSVDAGGRIYVYDAPHNRLTVFRHRGNPLAGGIEVDTTYSSFGVVAAIRAAPGGGVYIAGVLGLAKISAGSLKVEVIDNTLTNASDLTIQGNVLWFGTSNGVLRYDIDKKEKRWIGEADGLPSDNVQSVAVDEKKGLLWIVSDRAVSRLDIGRGGEAVSKESARVFPNVFSISGKTQGASAVTFARLAPRSTVSVYTVNGALVAKVSSEYFAGNEWRAAWTPKRNLTPGTYIAVIKPSGKKVKILLKP